MNPFDDVMSQIWDTLSSFAESFNDVSFLIFQFANFILFLVHLGLGVNLLWSAKSKENDEMIHGVNLEYIKKKGRIGTIVYILIGFGFLFKLLTYLLLICFDFLPTPLFLNFFNKENLFNEINLTDSELKIFELFFARFTGLLSFLGIIFFSIGIYLIAFNKSILRTKYKPMSFFLLGVFLLIIFGVTPSLRIILYLPLLPQN